MLTNKFFEQPLTDLVKQEIDEMTQHEMAYDWRFSKLGTFRSGDVYDYWHNRFWKVLGGLTPEISKSIGWDN